MAIHTCRDFLSLSPTGAHDSPSFPSASMYLTALFLHGVLNYQVVGKTNFEIQYTNNPSRFFIASGTGASINFGAGSGSVVAIPGFPFTTTILNNCILALRSDAFPRFNSGLFRITGSDIPNNRLIIDYRSTDSPPAETGSLQWKLYVPEYMPGIYPVSGAGLSVPNDIQQPGFPYFPAGGSPTSAVGYKSSGLYTGRRIILQSPHSSSWQVRLCYESSTDRAGATGFKSQVTCAPGFGGNSVGDFPSGSLDNSVTPSEHLHGPLWFDSNQAGTSSHYRGTVVGIEGYSNGADSDIGQGQLRFSAWGDSVSGSACFVQRNITNQADAWFSFGMAEDDEPLPPRTSQRLFAIGRSGNDTMDVFWNNGSAAQRALCGVAFGLNMQPVNCVMALYDYVGNMGTTGIKSEAVASDNGFLGVSELQKVDLWAGTADCGEDEITPWPASNVLRYDPRRMGSMPIARLGRANFTTWSLSSDSAWYHAKNGVYFPWSGPAVLA